MSSVLIVVTLIMQRDPPSLTPRELVAIAARDDPPIGAPAPARLKSHLGTNRKLVVYLPECSGCNLGEALPPNLPASLDSAIFVKRTAEQIPSAVASRDLVIDIDGDIQRRLNSFGAPRIFRFQSGRLSELQNLDESWADYLARSTR